VALGQLGIAVGRQLRPSCSAFVRASQATRGDNAPIVTPCRVLSPLFAARGGFQAPVNYERSCSSMSATTSNLLKRNIFAGGTSCAAPALFRLGGEFPPSNSPNYARSNRENAALFHTAPSPGNTAGTTPCAKPTGGYRAPPGRQAQNPPPTRRSWPGYPASTRISPYLLSCAPQRRALTPVLAAPCSTLPSKHQTRARLLPAQRYPGLVLITSPSAPSTTLVSQWSVFRNQSSVPCKSREKELRICSKCIPACILFLTTENCGPTPRPRAASPTPRG